MLECRIGAVGVPGKDEKSRASCRPRESLSHGVNTGGADLRGDAMRHYSVVVDAYLTARAKTESVTGVHNDSLIGAMVAHKKL